MIGRQRERVRGRAHVESREDETRANEGMRQDASGTRVRRAREGGASARAARRDRENGFVDHRGRADVNAFQIAGGTTWMCEVVGFILFAPACSDVARACAMGAYGALACVAFVSFFIACGVDPAARKISEDEVERGTGCIVGFATRCRRR